jgi:hypothetical protein
MLRNLEWLAVAAEVPRKSMNPNPADADDH